MCWLPWLPTLISQWNGLRKKASGSMVWRPEAKRISAMRTLPGCRACIRSEGDGIRALVKKNCDGLLRIPMNGKVNSLNVSASAAVVMYEVVRQRKLKSEGSEKVEKGKKENKILIFQCVIRNAQFVMFLSKTTMKVILASLMFLCGLACAAEEVNPRRMYKEGFEQMQSRRLIYLRGRKEQQNHFGFGASGTFLMRFENWTTTNLNDGFC